MSDALQQKHVLILRFLNQCEREVSWLNIHGPTWSYMENVPKNIATEEYPGKECVIRRHT